MRFEFNEQFKAQAMATLTVDLGSTDNDAAAGFNDGSLRGGSSRLSIILTWSFLLAGGCIVFLVNVAV